jgi:carbamoyltransferase
MHILGLSFFYHDSAAVLLRDGALVAASEEERFSRTKHDFGFPDLSIRFCLEEAGIEASDLDYVVFYE